MTKVPRKRFISVSPFRGLLHLNQPHNRAKGYQLSLAGSSFCANGTGGFLVPDKSYKGLWYFSTKMGLPCKMDCGGRLHEVPPGKFPKAFRKEMTMGFSPSPGMESSRSPEFSISPENSPNWLVAARTVSPR